ncbi:P-loop containing nucleoside triphosphate hydrolase protein, partial [Xylariales sp. AK1849]
MRQPLSVGAFTIPHSPALPLSDIPIDQLLESPVPDKSLHDELTSLFTKTPATFYHGTSDFYALKKNTQIPEICILGRSNVGKSTFVNALANRRGNELAHTSSRAGRTKAMNAFGFGPPPPMSHLADTDTETKRTEDLPKHSFFIVDMPGYGHKSLKDWGRHINLYLNKRQAVKGAVVLIDGEVGPKKGDLIVLEILQEAGLRTAVVLTKADKAKDEEMLKGTCKDMWEAMRHVNGRDPNSAWKWEKDFFVTALGATKKEIGAESVAIARLAVARLAGMVKEKDRPEQEAAKGYTGKIISFDDLQF